MCWKQLHVETSSFFASTLFSSSPPQTPHKPWYRITHHVGKPPFRMWSSCFPCRLKRLFVGGLNFAARGLFTALLAVVPPKMRARVKVVRAGSLGREIMAAELGRECLPLSLTDLPRAQALWKERVAKHLASPDQPLLPPLSKTLRVEPALTSPPNHGLADLPFISPNEETAVVCG